MDPPSFPLGDLVSADATTKKKTKTKTKEEKEEASSKRRSPSPMLPPAGVADEGDMALVDPSFLGAPSAVEEEEEDPPPPPPPRPAGRVLAPTFSSENGAEETGIYLDEEGSVSYRRDDRGDDAFEESVSLELETDGDDDDDDESDVPPRKSRSDRHRDRNRDKPKPRTIITTTTSSKRKKRRHRHPSTSSQPRLPLRYRGFSTSISSLFLDESIVCGAISCCGLLLSSRTEYLLNERNVKRGLTRRGTKQGGSRAPSRILGVSLVVTIVLVVVSYVVWDAVLLLRGGGKRR